MEIDKPTPTNVPGPSSEPAPLGPCAPGPSPCASPSNGNGSGHRRGEGKKNAKKRHSFSALSVSQRAAQLNNRHSMEISHPILISSSDPRAAARIQVHMKNTNIQTAFGIKRSSGGIQNPYLSQNTETSVENYFFWSQHLCCNAGWWRWNWLNNSWFKFGCWNSMLYFIYCTFQICVLYLKSKSVVLKTITSKLLKCEYV